MGFILYVMCHDDASLAKANSLCEEWRSMFESFELFEPSKSSEPSELFEQSKATAIPILLPPSPFMESSIYSILAQEKNREVWEKEDYVGIVTYSILDKLAKFRKQKVNIDWKTVIKQAHEKDIDVIGLFCLEFKRAVSGEKEGEFENIGLTLLESGVFHHGFNFYRGWRDLLLSMGHSQNAIDDWSETSGFFCNWWVSKPEILNEYIKFIQTAIEKVETNEALQKVFYKNSHYGRGNITAEQKIKLFGKPYYPIHPFVFERLLSFFLSLKKNNNGELTKEKPIRIGSINNMVMRI